MLCGPASGTRYDVVMLYVPSLYVEAGTEITGVGTGAVATGVGVFEEVTEDDAEAAPEVFVDEDDCAVEDVEDFADVFTDEAALDVSETTTASAKEVFVSVFKTTHPRTRTGSRAATRIEVRFKVLFINFVCE